MDDKIGAGVAEEFRRVAGDGTAGDDDEGVGQLRILPPRADLAEGLALGGARHRTAVQHDDVWRLTLLREPASGGEKLRREVGFLGLVESASESPESDLKSVVALLHRWLDARGAPKNLEADGFSLVAWKGTVFD